MVRLAINTYRSLRLIRTGSRYHVVGYSTCGAPAGCILALLFTTAFCIEPCDVFVQISPGVQLDVYVDDFGLSFLDTPSRLFHQLPRAAKYLYLIVRLLMGCDVSFGKVDLVSSSPFLLKRLREAFGKLVGNKPIRDVAVNLGVDFKPGGVFKGWAFRRKPAPAFARRSPSGTEPASSRSGFPVRSRDFPESSRLGPDLHLPLVAL